MILRTSYITFAIILIGLGLIVLPLPIPFGAIMIVLGTAILISNSETAAKWVRLRRSRNAWLNQTMSTVGDRLPGRFGSIIRRTAP